LKNRISALRRASRVPPWRRRLALGAAGAGALCAAGLGLVVLIPTWPFRLLGGALLLAALSTLAVWLFAPAFEELERLGSEIQSTERVRDRFRALVEHSSHILAALDRAGYVTWVSPSVFLVLGFQAEDLIGRPVLDFVHPEDRRAALRAFLEPSLAVELRIAHSDGGWVRLEAVGSDRSDDPAIQGVIVNARDVTEEHRAREELIRSEARYRNLFESSRDAIYIATVDGRLEAVNPACVELFGYGSEEEMMSIDITHDLYADATERERAHRVFVAQGFVEELELELKTKGGQRLRVLETASAIYDENGELIGSRGILRDVTEQRKLEHQLRQKLKMDALGRLASGVAHDFNNLLTAINGYTDLLLARLEKDSPVRNLAQEVRTAGRRAADLTRRLLHLNRQEPAILGPLDLNKIVRDMEKLLQRVIGEDVALETHLDPDLGLIRSDIGQIEQMILKLAANARDAMPDGGRLILETDRFAVASGLETVYPAALIPGEYARFTVRDTGVGMPEEIRERLFEPFFSTKQKGEREGMGLAMVYNFVERCGGAIEVDSTPEVGTTIHLYLPLGPSSEAFGTLGEMPVGEETVLLVEDEESVRSLVCQCLERQGYTVLSAASAEEAIALWDESPEPPHLLLTDVVMPDRSGPSLAEELLGRSSELQVLYMSGYADGIKSFARLPRQSSAFLQKPFNPQVLAVKVREVLDRGPDPGGARSAHFG